ncbi:transporter, putative [Trypanosoma equiperdum]|uniref:Uncharacterized protein n=2 Tax=Trypanozoon TaxID=39700 RepID=Q57X25_TRYB2|nr:hypothetical protein, conserved [Trypanosoma brucei brucei TREU927]AAX69842.1 hypothetical protein, conserved [Trypanosoma brucei]AAZ13321.1 hypothetical protein, conserved [Trypanosoma brucei brucei TREU927]SCU67194.1 transporter, putative [Trypanosoma equiperdum]
MIADAVPAVTQVVFAICFCTGVSTFIPNLVETAKDMSVFVSHLLIPSLTFYNIATPLSVELLKKCSVLILFAALIVVLGVLIAQLASFFLFRVKNTGIPRDLQRSVHFKLLRRRGRRESDDGVSGKSTHILNIVVNGEREELPIEPRDVLERLEPPEEEYENEPFYCCAMTLALCVQNAVTIPLSLLQALAETLPWIDLEAGTAYIFMYSIVTICVVWGVGPVLVRRAKKTTDKRRIIRELMEQQRRLQNCHEATTQTEVSCTTSRLASPTFPMLSDPPANVDGSSGEARAGGPVHRSGVAPESSTSDRGAARYSIGEVNQSHDAARCPIVLLTTTPSTCQIFGCDLVETGQIRVISRSQFAREEAEANAGVSCLGSSMAWLKRTVVQLLRTPSFTSVILGVFVGIISPLKGLFVGGNLSPVMDILSALAKGSIPCSLFLLAANFMNPKATVPAPKPVRMRDAEQNTDFPLDDITVNRSFAETYYRERQDITFDIHASFTPAHLSQPGTGSAAGGRADFAPFATSTPATDPRKGFLTTLYDMFSLNGINKNFMFGVIVLRLIVMPAVGYGLVLAVLYISPSMLGGGSSQNVLLLVLLGQLASPSAINCNILFVAERYMPHVWAKMLFFQYVCCIVTLTGWYGLSIYIVR